MTVLEESAARFDAACVHVATWPDGKARILTDSTDWPKGAIVWTGAEMLAYCQADAQARALIRGLKSVATGKAV